MKNAGLCSTPCDSCCALSVFGITVTHDKLYLGDNLAIAQGKGDAFPATDPFSLLQEFHRDQRKRFEACSGDIPNNHLQQQVFGDLLDGAL